MEVLALVRSVLLRLVAKMSERFLEQRIKFFVKLGKNASDTCAVLFEAYGGEAVNKSQVFSSGINGSKRVTRTWKWWQCSSVSSIWRVLVNLTSLHKAILSTMLTTCKCWSGYVKLFRKRPELWSSDWILHHDNVPSHKALFVNEYVAQESITDMEHPSYSPYMTLNDFWLFPEINSPLKGPRFQDVEDNRKNVTALKAVPLQKFQKYFEQLQHHWAKCIAAQGEYFEGDPSQ